MGDGEDERDQEAVAHVAHHGVHRHAGVAAVAVRLLGTLHPFVVMGGGEWLLVRERVAHVPGHGAAGAVVAAFLDPLLQLLNGRMTGVEDDGRSLRNGVRLDGGHAWTVPEHPLDDRLLGGVVQVADVQDRRSPPAVGRERLPVLVGVPHRFTSTRVALCSSSYCARQPREQKWIVSPARSSLAGA